MTEVDLSDSKVLSEMHIRILLTSLFVFNIL